jgi:hypothetical protein
MFRRLTAVLAVLGLTLVLAAPALADTVHQTNIFWDDVAFQGDEGECADADLAEGEVLWHFVHIGTDGSDLPATLTATFERADGTTFTETAEGYSNGDGTAPVMYDIITTDAVKFVTGSDTLDTDEMTEPLNLSHICAGGPGEEIPEAPASALLVITAAVAGLGFLLWRGRRSEVIPA